MRNAYLIFLLGFFVLFLAGCGDTEENPNQDAPYFNSIGTPTVTAGETMNFTVTATDPNDMNVTLTYDGSLGPNMNPFTAGASFNDVAGEFDWITDTNDVGTYSVRFTATNDAMPPVSTSINVTLQVLAVGNNNTTGEDLYNQHCLRCHSPPLVCRTERDINEALDLVGQMSGIAGQLSDRTSDVAAMAEYLGQIDPTLCLVP